MNSTPDTPPARCRVAESAYGRQCVKDTGHDRHGDPHEYDPEKGKPSAADVVAAIRGGIVERPAAAPTHEGPDPSHGGLTTHRGTREQCTGPDCGPVEDDTPTGQKYPASIGVYCDRCGATVEHDYIVSDDMTRQQRFAVARRHLVANEGWQCDGTGDLCPRCLAKAAEEQRAVRRSVDAQFPIVAAFLAEEQPAAEQAPAVLTDSVRQFLTFALDQAAEEMALRDGFTADDEAALATLRRLAEGKPRTERDHWQAIADALNAANDADMPVGIDLDGVLTDHNNHAVVWDFEAERWTLSGYEDADEAQPAEPAPVAVGQRYISRTDPARIVTITRVWTAADGHTAVAFEWRDNQPGKCGSACPLDVFHRAYRPEQP